ncbi:ATP phosphoribosyltransferase regulatory subunit [Clostridium formicaceticum]|uniref:ATP phosphoribosyltransferase regulatory subunit n=1 Tax=Clostridium formicaceticum TaxID=1497 RepID=A0AAC9RQ66_9CLOT|nr:ATP phosphoribosyltransferase regulatory subunit [Clostridium formicaceticum]AOY74581.1 hypothetical protein BJL90_00590 [Clostridium formicaceticum]ARE88943.1 ATP phosphoribosyltransferase regulatory subunit [Clostridium formicaceticum]
MLVNGTKEWFAQDAFTFLAARNMVEQELIQLGYDFFYSGILSKKSIYEQNIPILGESFRDIIFELGNGKESTIISPEGTFRVYEYLDRSGLLDRREGKVFYSQEFLRNETEDSVRQGKTISFWQIGYEIFGLSEKELSLTALLTLINCLSLFDIDRMKVRIADKRILGGIVSDLPQKEIRSIYSLIDTCQEDGEEFYSRYIKMGGNKEIALKIYTLFSKSNSNELSFEVLHEITGNHISNTGISYLKDIYRNVIKQNKNFRVEIVPYIAKTWDAYTTLLFDAWIDDYMYAIAGGGNLSTFYGEKDILKCGAGIGLTRIVEYMIKHCKLIHNKMKLEQISN